MDADSVGVITPYRAQVRLIRDNIEEQVTKFLPKSGDKITTIGDFCKRVEVNTVDQYQGRDKSVILYSCVRSCYKEGHHGEILKDKRRLNVSVTRARHKLIMIGDCKALTVYDPFRQLFSVLEQSQKFVMSSSHIPHL